MKKKSLLLLGASLGVLALGLAGCGGSKDEDSGSADGKTKISFTWWGAEVRHEKYIKAIEAFEKENPDVDIEYEYSSWDDYWKKLATKAAAGELPDIMQFDASYLSQYAEKKQLADITKYIKSNGTIDNKDMETSITEAAKLNEKIYGIPPAYGAMSMLYNENFLNKAKTKIDFDNYSFEDLNKAVLESSKENDEGYAFVDTADGNEVLLQYYLRTKGEDLYEYDKDGKPHVAFTKETFVDFMSTIQEWAKKGALPTAEFTTNLKSVEENPFAMGEAGFYQNWSNLYGVYQQSASEGVNLSIGKPYDCDTGALYYRPAFYYSIAENSKVKDVAAKFINFMINDLDAAKIMGTERGIPTSSKVRETIYADMTDYDKANAEYLEEIKDIVGTPSPLQPVGYSQLITHFKDLYAEITYGTMTPENAYNSYVEKAEEVYDENYK